MVCGGLQPAALARQASSPPHRPCGVQPAALARQASSPPPSPRRMRRRAGAWGQRGSSLVGRPHHRAGTGFRPLFERDILVGNDGRVDRLGPKIGHVLGSRPPPSMLGGVLGPFLTRAAVRPLPPRTAPAGSHGRLWQAAFALVKTGAEPKPQKERQMLARSRHAKRRKAVHRGMGSGPLQP